MNCHQKAVRSYKSTFLTLTCIERITYICHSTLAGFPGQNFSYQNVRLALLCSSNPESDPQIYCGQQQMTDLCRHDLSHPYSTYWQGKDCPESDVVSVHVLTLNALLIHKPFQECLKRTMKCN